MENINDFDRYDAAYASFFKGVKPARTTVQSVLSDGIKIEIVAFTDFYIDVIELHQKAARNSNGQKGLMAFYYNKFKQLYGPVVITNMNFTNTSKDTFIQLIDIDLKFVEVRKFVTNEDGVITTETLGANNFFQDQQLLAEGMPQNWFDELSRTDKFKEIENAVKNSINI